MKALKSRTVMNLFGITSRQLVYWQYRGVLWDSPRERSAVPGQRRGRPPGMKDRTFGLDDLIVVMLIRDLLGDGLSAEVAGTVVETLHQFQEQCSGEKLCSLSEIMLNTPTFLLIFNGSARIVAETEAWSVAKEASGATRLVTIIDLTRIAKAVVDLGATVSAVAPSLSLDQESAKIKAMVAGVGVK